MENYYPILSPNISYSHLNSEISLLTNLSEFNTKVLNQYQSLIIDMCNGQESLSSICDALIMKCMKIYSKTSIERFIKKMFHIGFLQFSPVKVKLNIPSWSINRIP